MSTSVDLTQDEIAQLQQITQIPEPAEAVGHAAREFVRLTRLRELKIASGRVEFEENWQELESIELKDLGFPS